LREAMREEVWAAGEARGHPRKACVYRAIFCLAQPTGMQATAKAFQVDGIDQRLGIPDVDEAGGDGVGV